MADSQQYHFVHEGQCPVCDNATRFVAHGPYFRSTLRCEKCNSAPRHRALMDTLESLFPGWRQLRIHESSPGPVGASAKLRRECPRYVPTHFDPSVPWGEIGVHGVRAEDLERQTFEDESFDLVITQDVFEHLFRPDLAIREIARTLRPGGAHIFTVPLTRRDKPTVCRASLVDGQIHHHLPAQYHGNPIDPNGSLVTFSYGFDLAGLLADHSGLVTWIRDVDKIDLGIRADLNEVMICQKLVPSQQAGPLSLRGR